MKFLWNLCKSPKCKCLRVILLLLWRKFTKTIGECALNWHERILTCKLVGILTILALESLLLIGEAKVVLILHRVLLRKLPLLSKISSHHVHWLLLLLTGNKATLTHSCGKLIEIAHHIVRLVHLIRNELLLLHLRLLLLKEEWVLLLNRLNTLLRQVCIETLEHTVLICLYWGLLTTWWN